MKTTKKDWAGSVLNNRNLYETSKMVFIDILCCSKHLLDFQNMLALDDAT